MLTLNNEAIEKATGRKVKVGVNCFGIDTASRTGWCKAISSKETTSFDYGFIDIEGSNRYFKYDQYIEIFSNMFKPKDVIVIEESFYGRNVKTFQFLSRIGGVAYTVAHINKCKDKFFILAATARKTLGFKGNLKKEVIHKEFIEKTGIIIDDEDIVDAIILALVGITE